jgi:hypothetical protein
MNPVALTIKVPLLSVQTVMGITALPNDMAVLALIETGKLAWSFNVAAPGSARRLVRISTESVCAYVQGGSDARTFEEVFHSVFPGKCETIIASNVARSLGCSTEHVRELLRNGSIRNGIANGKRFGPASSPPIARRELFTWLKSRRIA